MFFEPADEDAGPLHVSPVFKVGLAIAALGILVVGVYPQPFLDLATQGIQMLGMAF
jgi:NADH:ubiquinone oxidoreductase subunit 2 (subunit N)